MATNSKFSIFLKTSISWRKQSSTPQNFKATPFLTPNTVSLSTTFWQMMTIHSNENALLSEGEKELAKRT